MQPGPLLLAREIAPLLTRLDWGIGGSTLLFKHRLFGRHERAQQLADYLAKTGIRSGSS